MIFFSLRDYQNTQIASMNYQAKSIRSFIGAKDFNESRQFYRDFDFEEVDISMIFLQTDDVEL